MQLARARALAGALFVATIASARGASAGPFEVEGLGPAGVAEINARAARADDGSAAFYNPGGLGLGSGVRVELAPTLGVSGLVAQGKTRSLDDPFGVAIAFDATIPFTGALADRIRFGFAGYLPPTNVVRVIARPSDEPLFPYYDNRTQRLTLIPALAVRVTDRLGIGVGVNVLGGVSGPASVRPGASGAPESRLDLQATTTIALHAGIRFDPIPRLRLALAFRQRFAIPAVVTTRAVLGGVPLDVEVKTRSALYDPTAIVAAVSFDVGAAAFELDATYSVWSRYDGPFVGVHAALPGLNVTSELPRAPARDVVSLRAAGAYQADIGARTALVLRAGAGLEPSMLKSEQQGRTNMIDGDKVFAGLGATLVIRDLFRRERDGAPALRALRIGLGGSAQVVLPYEQVKRACAAVPCAPDTVAGPDALHPSEGITNPGSPALEGHGVFWSASLGVGIDL